MANNINRWLKVDNDDAWITLVITMVVGFFCTLVVVTVAATAAVVVATFVAVQCVGGWH